MTESKTIEFVSGLSMWDKYKYYSVYVVNYLYCKHFSNDGIERLPMRTFNEFCSLDNIQKQRIWVSGSGDELPSIEWINFIRPSIYSYIHLNIGLHDKEPNYHSK